LTYPLWRSYLNSTNKEIKLTLTQLDGEKLDGSFTFKLTRISRVKNVPVQNEYCHSLLLIAFIIIDSIHSFYCLHQTNLIDLLALEEKEKNQYFI
jgi:hypothetical protein